MASHFSTIGLPVSSDEDMKALANRVVPLAERLAAPSGAYFRWPDPSGAELWLQVNANNELIGMNPHYAGRSAVLVALTARVGPSELDGSFRGWVNPEGDAPATGYYEFVFDALDYRLHEELSLPVLRVSTASALMVRTNQVSEIRQVLAHFKPRKVETMRLLAQHFPHIRSNRRRQASE
jgi:hypothetical protein